MSTAVASRPAVAPTRPRRAPRAAPRRWARFLHLEPYALGDSLAGLRLGRRRGYVAVDLDFNMTADHVWANVHWPDLREHPVNRELTRGSVHHTPWHMVARARTRGGLRIRSAAGMLRHAKALGYERIEVEPKDVPRLKDFRRLKRHADALGLQIVVKRLSNIPGAVECLTHAHAAGITTMVLPRGTRVLSRSDYWPVTDYVRGPVKWKK